MRSWIFNQVLSERLRQGSWNTLLDGELTVDDVPSGPLWGRGRLNSTGEVRVLEENTVAELSVLTDALEWSGTKQERRKLVCRVDEWRTELDGSNLVVEFVLESGSYATSLLLEFIELPSLHCRSFAMNPAEHLPNCRNIQR